MIVTCPRCFSYDDVRPPRRLPDGQLEFTCSDGHGGTGPHVWAVSTAVVESPAASASAASRSAVSRPSAGRASSAKSGTKAAGAKAAGTRTRVNPDEAAVEELLEPLLACVAVGEPFVEYGIVEHRLRLAQPELFATHVRERGHLMLGARRGQASASTRFIKVLDRLASTGELLTVKGPGTGAWRLDQSIGYWARPPRPSGPHLTWTMYCATSGRSAEWTDADREPFVAAPEASDVTT